MGDGGVEVRSWVFWVTPRGGVAWDVVGVSGAGRGVSIRRRMHQHRCSMRISIRPHRDPAVFALSTILRPMDRAPRGNGGAGMLVRVEMGRVGDEFSRCGPSFNCSAGLMGALR